MSRVGSIRPSKSRRNVSTAFLATGGTIVHTRAIIRRRLTRWIAAAATGAALFLGGCVADGAAERPGQPFAKSGGDESAQAGESRFLPHGPRGGVISPNSGYEDEGKWPTGNAPPVKCGRGQHSADPRSLDRSSCPSPPGDSPAGRCLPAIVHGQIEKPQVTGVAANWPLWQPLLCGGCIAAQQWGSWRRWCKCHPNRVEYRGWIGYTGGCYGSILAARIFAAIVLPRGRAAGYTGVMWQWSVPPTPPLEEMADVSPGFSRDGACPGPCGVLRLGPGRRKPAFLPSCILGGSSSREPGRRSAS